MDFIETIFGLSPDGRNGWWETCLVVAIAVAIGVRAKRWRKAQPKSKE
jgi:hypothetical protein